MDPSPRTQVTCIVARLHIIIVIIIIVIIVITIISNTVPYIQIKLGSKIQM